MHAMLITFHSDAPVEDLVEPFTAYADQLRSVTGLVAKTWIRDGETLGGFHVFTSRADADRYLASEMVAGLTSTPSFEDFSIARFDVLDDLSHKNGTPTSPLVAVG